MAPDQSRQASGLTVPHPPGDRRIVHGISRTGPGTAGASSAASRRSPAKAVRPAPAPAAGRPGPAAVRTGRAVHGDGVRAFQHVLYRAARADPGRLPPGLDGEQVKSSMSGTCRQSARHVGQSGVNTLHSEITAVTTGLASELPGRDHAAEVGSVIAGQGCSLEDLTVAAPTNDPFRLGSPGPLPRWSASASLHGRYICRA